MNNKFISIMTARIVRDFNPLQIVLFGSQARGDAHRHSDIDLLVVFSEQARIKGKLLLIFELPWLTYPWLRTSL